MIEKLDKWERASNYIGEDFSNYYIVCGQHRDSDNMQKSNFITAEKWLRGDDYDKDSEEIIINRSSHWAVGWVEHLLIREDAKQELLDEALEIVRRIDEECLLDHENWSEIRADEVDELCSEIQSDIENGDIDRWKSYGIREGDSHERIHEIADDHVS